MCTERVFSKSQVNKDKEKEQSNIGVKFLGEQLMQFQVKLMVFESRDEARIAEYEAGEIIKQQEWPSTAVKAGGFLKPAFFLPLCLF